MMSQDNLPVWAKILLGIPVRDPVQPNRPEFLEQADSGEQGATLLEVVAKGQSVFVFGCTKREPKWRRQQFLRPMESEINS